MATWSRPTWPALVSTIRTAFRAIAALSVAALASAGLPAQAFVAHEAVTVRAADIEFYSGHLVLDAKGDASLDDGVLHVSADRIILDLTSRRYVAAGNVSVSEASSNVPGAFGAALGVDLSTHRGMLIAVAPAPASYSVDGGVFAPVSGQGGSGEPLALPDLQGERPFADATRAVAHLGADVRLTSAHVLVPGGKDVPLPSYVYTFGSDAGYSASNVTGSSEEVPIYFGSTRDSVDGAHFTYNAVTKVGLGLDHRIIDGDRAYDLFSVSPLTGPTKNANFTWQEQINGHASQTLNASSSSNIGSRWSYNLIDSVHRSFFQLSGSSNLGSNFETLDWQGNYEPLGSGGAGIFSYRLRSEYGRSQTYFSGFAASLYHTALEADLQTTPLQLNPSTSLSLMAAWRQLFDNLPHRQFFTDYGAQLQHGWSPFVTTTLSDDEIPVVDVYPSPICVAVDANGNCTSFLTGTRTYVSRQYAQLNYTHGDALGFTLGLTHQAGASALPSGPFVQPWYASLDVRFRVNSSLSLDVSRSYGFGFNGQRYTSLGFQILP